MYVCLCKGVTSEDVAAVLRRNVADPEDLVAYFGWDDMNACCGRCRDEAHLHLERAHRALGHLEEALGLPRAR